MVLTDEGNTVVIAGDGPSMRDAFAAESFDVVIIDIGLPGPENGIALARQAASRGCGVVLMTGHPGHGEAVARTGYCYLLKPFRVEALLEATERAVRATHARCVIRRGGR